MGNKLYVGNLSYSIRDDDLQQAFAQFGSVASAKVMMDRDTGRSKGFGFVEMGSDAEAQSAISGMHGKDLSAATRCGDFCLRAIVLSLTDVNPIPDGDLYCCRFSVHAAPGACHGFPPTTGPRPPARRRRAGRGAS